MMPPLGWKKMSPGPASSWMLKRSSSLPSLRWSRFFGLFHLFEVGVEVLGREKCRARDALELLIVLVALPVGAGDGEQLEGLDFRSVGQVRTAAEIDEAGSEGVLGEDLTGLLFDELAFHPGFGVFLEAFFLAGEDALVGERARLDLPHLLLDFFEVVGSERGGAVEIVVETVLDGRADAELGF